MSGVSPAMQAVLNAGGPFVVADLYDILLPDGTELFWTSAQTDLLIGNQLYQAGPPITRDKISWKRGLDVDQVALTVLDDDSTLINGQALVAAVWKNLFDYAKVTISMFVSDSWTNTAPGGYELFTGVIGEIGSKGKEITLTVESPLARLKSTAPRNAVLPSCTNTLYDAGCTLLEATYSFAGTVGAAPSATSFPLSGIAEADGYFTNGRIKFTSGANAGQVRGVKSYAGGVITLSYPLYTVPTAGDAVTAVAGCDYTRATCNGRFANIANFRGFPYVPDPNVQITGAAAASQSSGATPAGVGTIAGGGLSNRGGRVVINRV